MQKNLVKLVRDTTEMGNAYNRLTSLYSELTKSYDKLLSNNEKLLAGNTDETRKLIAELNSTRDELQRREERIKKDSLSLNERAVLLRQISPLCDARKSCSASFRRWKTYGKPRIERKPRKRSIVLIRPASDLLSIASRTIPIVSLEKTKVPTRELRRTQHERRTRGEWSGNVPENPLRRRVRRPR